MNDRSRTRITTACLVSLVCTGAIVTGQTGQPAPQPVRSLLQTVVVKAEAVPAWRELYEKEAIPAYKKAGVPWRWVFQGGPLSGPGNRFSIVSPVSNFAQFDRGQSLRRGMGDEAFAKYQARLGPLLVSTTNVLQTLIPAASLQGIPGAPPALIRVAEIQVRPGKTEEFDAITAREFLPAMKKAGVDTYLVFSTSYGAPTTQRTIVTNLDNYASLDRGGPVARALGADAARALNQKRDELTTSATASVLRFVPELSYGAPTGTR